MSVTAIKAHLAKREGNGKFEVGSGRCHPSTVDLSSSWTGPKEND